MIIANPVEANTPTVAGQAVASASAPVNAGTVLLTDSDDRCTPPASTHRQIRTCPPRAKGPLDRRSKWFSLVTFFLQKKKVTRAGARNAPSRARRRNTCSPPGRRPPRERFFVSDGPISSNSGRNGGKNAGRNCVSALPQRAIPGSDLLRILADIAFHHRCRSKGLRVRSPARRLTRPLAPATVGVFRSCRRTPKPSPLMGRGIE